jgi:putative N6-adenine-specific DNA methylase
VGAATGAAQISPGARVYSAPVLEDARALLRVSAFVSPLLVPCVGFAGPQSLLVCPMADRLPCLAVTAPGLAPLAEQELRAIGIRPDAVAPEGVSFRASPDRLYAANLWLRTATRIVVRVASFRAESFAELERRARKVAWSRYITAGAGVRIRVTCRKSRLYHSDAVAERIAGAVERAGGIPMVEAEREPETGQPSGAVGSTGQLIMARLFRDECTISMDSSGELLHRRGYRQETGKAPIRETLAAAVLMASGWECRGPLLDPMCGAGTLVIEGALLARRRAPGLARPFAFMQWPEFDAAAWHALVTDAQSQELASAPVPILGSDRDAGAMAAALGNATRACVADDIGLATCPISAIEPPAGPGWLVTNPPYGVRVGDRDRLRNLYAQLGQVARAKCPGWTIALVSGNRMLTRHTGLPFTAALTTTNGGLPVELVRAVI